MKIIAPSYYPHFSCSAGSCRHSCCIGWEIDIDEERLEEYLALDGPLGQTLRENIALENGAHFRLTEEERCPFLNPEGLCDLIISLGEDHLCQICADHPRFRNDWSDRTEMGLGLCCEAAAELILSHPEPMKLLVLSDDGGNESLEEEEIWLLSQRNQMISLVQDRSRSIQDRVQALLAFCGARFPEGSPADWAAMYLTLEQLDPQWTQSLSRLSTSPLHWFAPAAVADEVLEHLLVYFLYRHVPAALEDGDLPSKVSFAVLSVSLLHVLLAMTGQPAAELARMYSAEIEYSDENLELLWDRLCFESGSPYDGD